MESANASSEISYVHAIRESLQEMSNPIQNIMGCAELLSVDLTPESELQALARHIVDQCKELCRILRRLRETTIAHS